ncbi:MAG TPA: beta-ketoacyl synthase N-terminal-like domain-containing protein, partial [bacterium]|nr:beta-ketoacyl synthase N-terminal-like domain-containing protein [bacterium]
MKRYDIAVIGMGGIFPGSSNVEEYWKNVLSGKTFITDMPKKYWRVESYFSNDMSKDDKSYTKKGSFIDGFEFPFNKYKFPPNTMKGVDPAQLIALESAREALEDAGIKPHSKALDEAVTILGVSGVDDYAHACAYLRRNHYFDRLKKQLREKGVSEKQIEALSKQFDEEVAKRHSVKMSLLAVGVIPSALSNRVAQVFGAKGYNMTVDAACASSFGALETACHALMAGDAKIAITGGVDLGVNPAIYIGFSRVEGLSFSGISNPFDHKADGLIIGEGGGVVILKRLEDALADGDRIHAIIRGMGSSSDGAGQAIYSPSV